MARSLCSTGLMYHDRAMDGDARVMRQKGKQTKEKEVDLERGRREAVWESGLSLLKLWESNDEAKQLKGDGKGLLSPLFVL